MHGCPEPLAHVGHGAAFVVGHRHRHKRVQGADRRRGRSAAHARHGRARGGRRKFVYNSRAMLRFLTAGESHGRGLTVIVDGLPAGLPIDLDRLTHALRRRQGGYGRGRRMAIESDMAVVQSGVRRGRTTGAPVALVIENRDWVNWQRTMHTGADMPEGATGANRAPVVRPRPGHADLAGALKFEHDDVRDVLERASARETAARVAAGALAIQLLEAVGTQVTSHVTAIAEVALDAARLVTFDEAAALPADAPLAVRGSGVPRRG